MQSPLETVTNFWQPHLDTQPSSGLSGKAYCLKHDLNYHRFCYHKRKQQSDGKSVASAKPGNRKAKAFIPVSVASSSDGTSGLTVTLPNGICISGLHEEHPEVCAAFIRALL